MILIDTHIWIWWANDSPQLTSHHRRVLLSHQPMDIGISVYSCWEVAMAIHRGRLSVSTSALDWVKDGLSLPGARLIDLTPAIAVEATNLRGLSTEIRQTKSLWQPQEL